MRGWGIRASGRAGWCSEKGLGIRDLGGGF